MYRRTRADRFRESLFTLRDGLFDYMWKNDVRFDLPAYRLMRAFLNGTIWVAGRVTPTKCVLVMLMVGRPVPDLQLSATINQIEERAVRGHFRQTLKESIEVFLVVLGLFGWIIRLAVSLDHFKCAVRTQVDRSINKLVVFGSDDSVAGPLLAGDKSLLEFRQ